ncbi:DinB family protein [Chitinibacter fontanus]|uniref:DinB family protein n=1 Tax=Chitinibacter fontanus TaxID=1737446 RepID=A0A7D5V8L4_9NEIS|nr:DinB family protein [Chitinibacter fontanus]QLI80133.1 DinB family protein [Chitinibacter fontanus]
MPATLFRTLFEHKAWANQDLLTQLITHQQPDHAKSWRLATRLMNHLNIVDQIFIAHLTGKTHSFTATNTPETPDLLELQSRTMQTDQQLISLVSTQPATFFEQRIEFVFTDGKHGSMTAAEILMHLITHGSYHRGQIGRVIYDSNAKISPDILTGFLHRNRELN